MDHQSLESEEIKPEEYTVMSEQSQTLEALKIAYKWKLTVSSFTSKPVRRAIMTW
jgi:hypothetical protein